MIKSESVRCVGSKNTKSRVNSIIAAGIAYLISRRHGWFGHGCFARAQGRSLKFYNLDVSISINAIENKL